MTSITRRHACLLIAGAPLAAVSATGLTSARPHALARLLSPARLLAPRSALAEEGTAAALASAQEQQAQVQAQIDDIAAQQTALSQELDATLSSMEAKRGEIAQTQQTVDDTQAQVEGLQDELAAYVAAAYKQGRAHGLEVLLASSSFEELYRNAYYLTKVNDSEVQLIEQVVAAKEQLVAQQAELEAQYADLDALRSQQEGQLQEIQARQDEAYSLLSSLDEQVRQLTEQYNAELVAQAEAERAAAEAAAAAAAAQSSGAAWGSVTGTGSVDAVVNACYATPSPGAGYCAAWVTNVLQNAGVGYVGGNACDMYASWCYSSDRGSLQPGMIVAVSSHSHTSAGQIYGHVGIYVGGGTVMDNIGPIRSIDVDSWVSFYGTTVTPRWGWAGGIALS